MRRWSRFFAVLLTLSFALPVNAWTAFAASPSTTTLLAQAQASGFDMNAVLADSDIFGLGSMDRDGIQHFLDTHGTLGTMTLRDIDGVGKPASDIIWRVATSYKINPQYLLALMQKEQSLVEDTTPTQKQLDWATGYGVCDSCSMDDPAIQNFKGFASQLEWAAKQHREKYLLQILGQGATIAGQAPGKTIVIDGLSVTPANRATAMLFSYTPHIAGNLNLWRIWQRWFHLAFPDGTVVKDTAKDIVYLIRFGEKRPFASIAAAATVVDPDKIVDVTKTQLAGYPDGKPLAFANYALVELPDGTRFLIDGEHKRKIEDRATFDSFGFNEDEVVEATADDLAAYADGPDITKKTTYPLGLLAKDGKGAYWYVEDGVRHLIPSKTFLLLYFHGRPARALSNAKLATYALGDPYQLHDGELVRTPEESAVYVIENGNKRPIASGDVFEALGWKWTNVVTLPASVLKGYPTGEPVDVGHAQTQLATAL